MLADSSIQYFSVVHLKAIHKGSACFNLQHNTRTKAGVSINAGWCPSAIIAMGLFSRDLFVTESLQSAFLVHLALPLPLLHIDLLRCLQIADRYFDHQARKHSVL